MPSSGEGVTLKSGGGRAKPSSSSPPRILQPLNPRRYFWLVVGYYLVAMYVRETQGRSDSLTNADFSSEFQLGTIALSKQPTELLGGEPSHHDPNHVGGKEGGHEAAEEHGIKVVKVDFEEVETPFIIALWIFCASLAKIGFHMAPKLSHIFPESCLLIIVGIVIGFLLFHTQSVHVSPLTPKTFFHFMLPPIILDAGYFMPNRLFFNNLGTILLFAVIGTIWNTFAIGLSLWGLGFTSIFGEDVELTLLPTLLFSALISAVDPVAVLAVFEEIHVNEVLYIVVFGESLLNDAVTVVLYHMFEDYAKMGASNVTGMEVIKGIASFPVVALGGTAIGIIWGFLTGFVTRFTNHVRVIEPVFIFVMAYLSFLCAETFHMSGILAITFCGITMKNYVQANISHKSNTTVKYAMKMLSSSAETIIFMFLGVSTIHDEHNANIWFIVFTILFCTIYRIIGTVALSALANRFRLHKLGRVDQFVMSYGGLRGAVAFALVLLIKDDAVNKDEKLKKMFVTTTIAVIYFTVFLQGITIKPLVCWLKVKRAEKRKPTMNERIHERLMDHTMVVLESIVGQVGHYKLRDKFKQFDNAYIRPCLIRDLKGSEPKILETFSKLAMRDAMDMMNRNPMAPMNGGLQMNKLNAESMAALIRNYNSANNIPGGSGDATFDANNWNLDLQELEYSMSRKDMNDAKIHHLLAEELYKPGRRHRRLSYSRHAVNENDLGPTEPQPNYRQQMNFKRMVSERAMKSGGKTRRTGNVNKDGSYMNGRISYGENGEEYDNPVFSMSDEAMAARGEGGGEGDVGIYFIAGGGQTAGDGQKPDWNERRWSQSSCSSVKSFMEREHPHNSHPIHRHPGQRRFSKYFIDEHDEPCSNSPTIAELTLPWRRDQQNLAQILLNNSSNNCGSNGNPPNSRFRVSPARRMTIRDEDGNISPTTMDSVLPWKRTDDDHDAGMFPVRQNEFPAWASNKEYLAYNSPTNTFLGGIGGQPKMPSVIGLFKRDSIGSTSGSRRGSLQSLHQLRMDSPRHSIGSDGSAGFELRMSGGDRGDMESGGGGGGGGNGGGVAGPSASSSVGLVPRRGSTFLATPILEDPEETDAFEGSRSSSDPEPPAAPPYPGMGRSETSGDNNAGGDAAANAEAPSTSSPSHTKLTSPSHISHKSPLEIIEETDGPGSSSDPDPHTKL